MWLPEISGVILIGVVVVAIEEQWFTAGSDGPPLRAERKYRINECLYAATDEEQACEMAHKWLKNDGFSDSNHDGKGDVTRMFAIGIHELAEIAGRRDLPNEPCELYGIQLPGFCSSDIDSHGVSLVRKKEDLEVFRVLKLHNAT